MHSVLSSSSPSTASSCAHGMLYKTMNLFSSWDNNLYVIVYQMASSTFNSSNSKMEKNRQKPLLFCSVAMLRDTALFAA